MSGVITGGGDDWWSAVFPLPAGVVSADGAVTIGMTRRDGAGFVSSWPRAMYPGQVEPGRLLVDLRFWMGL